MKFKLPRGTSCIVHRGIEHLPDGDGIVDLPGVSTVAQIGSLTEQGLVMITGHPGGAVLQTDSPIDRKHV